MLIYSPNGNRSRAAMKSNPNSQSSSMKIFHFAGLNWHRKSFSFLMQKLRLIANYKVYKLSIINSEYMTKYTVLIEQDEEGWFVSEVVELPGCHTQAKTLDELVSRTKEAIQAYLEKDTDVRIETKFVGIQQIEIA